MIFRRRSTEPKVGGSSPSRRGVTSFCCSKICLFLRAIVGMRSSHGSARKSASQNDWHPLTVLLPNVHAAKKFIFFAELSLDFCLCERVKSCWFCCQG